MHRCAERGPRGRILTWLLLTAGGLCFGGSGIAQSPKAVPLSTFLQQIATAQQLVKACADGNEGACNPAALPDRELVQGGPNGDFTVSWQWLAEEISNSKTASATEKTRAWKAASAHLTEWAAEVGAGPTRLADEFDGARAADEFGKARAADEFRRARAAADTALARNEFRASDEGPTWTERQIAKLQDWLLRLFTGMDRVGKRAPWLAPLIEWGSFALAAAGLLWFVRQSLARQALRISLSEGAALAGKGERDSADWTRLAEEHAAAGDWREAVHCLFWAAIALMEGRRAWRSNATRTPREYARLLKPGTEAHGALRELTRNFERIWYGHGEADQAQYEAALAHLRVLESSKPERVPADVASGVPVAAAGAA